ncbi:MAG: Eukaryotic translation initiation factor 2-alpha kinase 3, variant 2, partial [Marteilia pararefringens]
MLISLYVSILLLTTSTGNHYEIARESQSKGQLFSFADCQTNPPGGAQLNELSIAGTHGSATGSPRSHDVPDERCLADGDDEANRYNFDKKNCRFKSSQAGHGRDSEPGTTCSSTQGEGWKKYVSRVPQSGNFLLVNTIDGRIHAFLLKCDNVLKYKWTFVLDEKQFEHNLNSLDFGERFLIPSLSGNLYSFDGKSLFQVHLPNNQPQINLDVSFSGGSTVNLYGIDFLSGEVVYKCVNGECST